MGRQKHKADRAFAQWVRENGFDDMPRQTRADAMWLADNWSEVSSDLSPDLAHPVNIRQAYREQQATQALPEDLQTATVTQTPTLPQRDAEKVNKLRHRAESGDEGSEIADRHLKAFAKKHGVDLDALLQAAAEGDPDGYHRLTGRAPVVSLSEIFANMEVSPSRKYPQTGRYCYPAMCKISVPKPLDCRHTPLRERVASDPGGWIAGANQTTKIYTMTTLRIFGTEIFIEQSTPFTPIPERIKRSEFDTEFWFLNLHIVKSKLDRGRPEAGQRETEAG